MALQSDGKIIVAGSDPGGPSDPKLNPGFCIERRLVDGSPDLGYNRGELRTYFGIHAELKEVALQPDGKLLAVGRGRDGQGNSGVVVARYNNDGVIDSTYGNGGKRYVPVTQLFWYVGFTFARDGGIVAAGFDYSLPNNILERYRPTFVKVDLTARLDPLFGDGGIVRLSLRADVMGSFLRDVEDRWLIVSSTYSLTQPFYSGEVIERFRGESPDPVSVIEYFNVNLGHYFITASVAEAAGIDAGAAGPGWQRTGYNLRAWQPAAAGTLAGVPQSSAPLCRFYGTPGLGPNSHFYTIDTTECDIVRWDTGWTFENLAFYAMHPIADTSGPTCAQGLLPVFRAYNSRFPQNDSNHRYTTIPTVYRQMQQQGWIGEGVVFCSPAN